MIDEKEAKLLLLKWKIVMNLGVWRTHLIYDGELPPLVRGRVYWEGGLKDATILINSNHKWGNWPVEKTIIHELLHLKFAELGDPAPHYIEDTVIELTEFYYERRNNWALTSSKK